MHRLQLWFEGGEESLRVRSFSVEEGLSRLFDIGIRALSPKADVDLEKIVGRKAAFSITTGLDLEAGPPLRMWTGYCSQAQLVAAETTGDSTYVFRFVPELWLLGQRRGHRLYHDKTLPEIVEALLAEWKIAANKKLSGSYPKHELVVQYGETDLEFVLRLLEWAGITYQFSFEGGKTELWLLDEPHTGDVSISLPYVDRPNREVGTQYVTRVKLRHEVRPGKLVVRDHDFRRLPDTKVVAESKLGEPPEDFYEHYEYGPGQFWVEGKGSKEPVADDRGTYRHDEGGYGKALVERRMQGMRQGRERVRFGTNCIDVWPGRIFQISDYPHPDVGSGKLLCDEYFLEGTSEDEWTFGGAAVFCELPYRPAARTPKPRIQGVQSAIVVGPPGKEIHTDEHGRVRAQFHWDREGKYDEKASCWMRVSQSWAGAGFGTVHIPRVGQEVLVGFLDGDPDHPVVVGRVYNATSKVPHSLPAFETRSSWKSNSTPNASGFNELMFDDAADKELVYVQAQRDLQKLVKNHDSERTGVNRSTIVGHDRSEVIGKLDSLLSGNKYLLQCIAPPSKEDLKVAGQGVPAVKPKPTQFEVKDKRLILTTGKATIAIDDKNIFLEASGNITIKSKGGDVVLQGSKVMVNTVPVGPAPKPDSFTSHDPKTVQIQAPHAKAKLKAPTEKGAERQAGTGEPTAPKLEKEAPVPCKLVKGSEIVHCQHDGRKPNDEGVLEVVPALMGDTITLSVKAAPKCGKHPEWHISTPAGTETKPASTTMEAKAWNVLNKGYKWLGGAHPKQYSAWASACSGSTKHYIIKAYPKDKLSISLTSKDFEPAKHAFEAVQAFLRRFINPDIEVEGLKGSLKIEAAWAEYDDWRAYYGFMVSVGFQPLFAIKARFPFGPSVPLPGFMKKYVDIGFFIELSGDVSVAIQGGRDQPGKPRISGKAEGSVGAKLGAAIKIGSAKKKAVDVECYGSTSISVGATPRFTEAEGPLCDFEAKWGGLVATIKVGLWDGRIEKEWSLQVVDERQIMKRTWLLHKKGEGAA